MARSASGQGQTERAFFVFAQPHDEAEQRWGRAISLNIFLFILKNILIRNQISMVVFVFLKLIDD
jgi:hypothetical protein